MLKRSKSQTPSIPARVAKFIAVHNEKGGVAKTEICRNAAHRAIELRCPIILFDVDSQRDSSVLMLPEGKTWQDEHPDFERTEFVLVTQNFADVKAFPERMVIADCPPQSEVLSILAQVADVRIIPVGCDSQEVQHAIEVSKKLTQPFVFVLSRWDFDVDRSNEFISALFAAGRIFYAVIHQDNNVVAEARAKRLPVWEIDEELGDMFEALADWILTTQCSEHPDYFLDEHDLNEILGVDDFKAIRNRSRVRYEA